MPQFRKKPVVIEAVRYDGNVGEILAFIGRAASLAPLGVLVLIKTLEGEMCAAPGDWIIRGVAGEFYPCKPEIFSATYEPVADNASDPHVADPGNPSQRVKASVSSYLPPGPWGGKV